MQFDVRNQGIIPLIHHPDFSALGYEVLQELGRNQEGGRITYLAKVSHSHQQVVIKAFSLAHAGADWLGVTAYQREVEILQRLNHPRIPRYLNSFATPTVFYIIQEYKNAPSLASRRSFKPEEIKQIAVSMLEILVYLQQQVDPIIHRDIKPENILLDEHLNAYLVDFDLAQVKGEKMALSSLAAGTPGFMPPEEQNGDSLTQASDLYSLGATLICLLTATRSGNISKLIDSNYRFHFQKLIPHIHPRFEWWLSKMVEPKSQHRYPNAATALAALQPIQPTAAANAIETLVASVRLRKQTAVLGLATMAMLAVAGITLIMSQQDSAAQPVQEIGVRE
ncbi:MULTISPECIES: serine/threonine-protein kinase [unclassified Anabaena]|uniref:serine/threonine protein kinase n=1 Tax=unclassified Anabaena TaxID=2619674 RepID=UPI00082D47F2|nr:MULTISPECIES: serine/threonine-protein kinase [unclassified Anabaena]